MAMSVINVWTCDRCASVTRSDQEKTAAEYGYTNIQWEGCIGCREGGVSHKGKSWLCLKCTYEFLKFVKPQEPNHV